MEGCTCCWIWALAPSKSRPHRQRSMTVPGTTWTSREMVAQVRMEGKEAERLKSYNTFQRLFFHFEIEMKQQLFHLCLFFSNTICQ